MDDLLETSELAAFARIVELGSLSRAAQELGVPRATIGRRLSRLEQRLGARLVRRTTRSLTLTDEGRALYEHTKHALSAVRDAARSVRPSDGVLRGRIRVSVPPLPGPSFHAFVADFLARHPEVSIEVESTSVIVRLGEEGWDVAVRASDALDPGLVRRPLSQVRLVAVASPDYLARRGTPRSAADLASHACLLGYARGEVPRREWPLRDGGTVRVTGPLASNDVQLVASAARSGLGIALLPESMIAPWIESGDLVHVLEDEVGSSSQVAVVFPERELLRPVVRAFVEELVRWCKRELPRLVLACHEHERFARA